MWIAFVVPVVLMVGCVLLERYEHWIFRIRARRSAAATSFIGKPVRVIRPPASGDPS